MYYQYVFYPQCELADGPRPSCPIYTIQKITATERWTPFVGS
jgi:hypothetical protein